MPSVKASSQDDIDPVKMTSVPSVAEGVVKNETHADDEAQTDAGLAFYREALSIPLERREEIAAMILKKIDFTLLPFTLNYSNAYGLQEALGLKGRDYSWVASVTNIGYLVGAYPSNLALQKFPIGKFISCMLLSWGILLCAAVGAKNFAGIMALRFLLGAFEACIGPAWMLITSMFWTRDEQPLRMCIWLGCNGIAQLLGAGISWGIGHSNSTVLEPFQLIFLTIGVITLAVGLVALFLFPNSPMDYKVFSAEEKAVAVWRVSGNQTGIKHSKILWHQVKEAFMDPRAYCVTAQQLSIGIINGSIANFMSALLKGFGYTSEQNVMYQLPNGAFQLVSTVAAGWFSSKVKNMTIITICVVHVPSIAGIIGVATINISHRLALTACCWLLGIVGAAIILNWSIIAGNFAGHTKRMTINSANFIFYAAGNVIGPFMFIPEEAPRYMTAIKALCGVYASSMLFTALMGIIMFVENKRRDKLVLEEASIPSAPEEREEGFLDFTDRENKSFRYRL